MKYGTEELNKMADPANWELWDAPATPEVLYQYFPEFTCLCPRSGYPDFAKVHIISFPNKKVIELRCLKLWLNSFRNEPISHEQATQKIAQTLFDRLGLNYIFVLMEYTPRGNLTTYPMTAMSKKEFNGIDEIQIIKKRLLEKII